MYAKKSLGQHFLRSERAIDSIIRAADIQPGDLVLEIGPGEGVLTEKLLAYGLKLIAVEKDDQLYEFLKIKFAQEISSERFVLVHGDILNFEFESYSLQAISYKLVANIPYNITGAILEKFLSANYQPERMVLLVQKEVAERIVAKDGKESILSISVKAYGKPHYVETVKAGSFAPAPKVDSAIISINPISKRFFDGFSEKRFFELLKAGFSSKRKKLSSNLSHKFDKHAVSNAFKDLNLDTNTRAEDVGLAAWQNLAKKVCISSK